MALTPPAAESLGAAAEHARLEPVARLEMVVGGFGRHSEERAEVERKSRIEGAESEETGGEDKHIMNGSRQRSNHREWRSGSLHELLVHVGVRKRSVEKGRGC